jgi:hypothetical protein
MTVKHLPTFEDPYDFPLADFPKAITVLLR